MQPFKKCTCCGRLFTADEWAALDALGHMDFVDEDGTPKRLVMANCPCGSTLGIEVKQ